MDIAEKTDMKIASDNVRIAWERKCEANREFARVWAEFLTVREAATRRNSSRKKTSHPPVVVG